MAMLCGFVTAAAVTGRVAKAQGGRKSAVRRQFVAMQSGAATAKIERFQVGERMSQAVKHAGVVYTAGQVAQKTRGGTVTAQTEEILGNIDKLLAEAGTDKSKLISTTIWITNMDDFGELNAAWVKWLVKDAAPVRACVECKLVSPEMKVEIAVIAAA